MQPIIILIQQAHQQDVGNSVCIYSCKKKSKYSAVNRTLCLKKIPFKILSMLLLGTNNPNAVNSLSLDI